MTRILIGKAGLDGHDRGALALAYALRDAGLEVIYTGLRMTPEELAITALQEDVDVIGISFLSGSHLSKIETLTEELNRAGMDEYELLVGGVIPPKDVPKLKELGVSEVFGPETSVEDILTVIDAGAERDRTDPDGEPDSELTKPRNEIVSGGIDASIFETPIKSVYTHEDLSDFDPEERLGRPGEFPFTRGISPEMYRDELWVMGMYSGHGTPEETNDRLKELIESGETGFSIALDLPTQLGLDADDPDAEGEVGRTGTPICSQRDLETIFDDIALDEIRQIRTSANSIGPIFSAFAIGAARSHGYEPDDFKILLQNDPLKEYVVRGTHIFSPEAALKLSVDVMEYFTEHITHWEPIEFCEYHYRDAGLEPSFAVACALGDAFEYLDEAQERGLPIEDVIRNVYIFMSAVGNRGFFEVVAKFRATRRLWAELIRERYGVEDEEALKLNIFSWGGIGSALTGAEPKNNIVRTAYGSLAAVLGGVDTLAVHGYDEALGLPSEDAARVALRTQQILAHETGVTKTADPLAGSYFVENLTDDFEDAVSDHLDWIEQAGGMLSLIQNGKLKREIANRGYEELRKVETGDQPVVGVNIYAQESDETDIKPFEIDPSVEDHQRKRLESLRRERNESRKDEALESLRGAVKRDANTVPALLEASAAYATLGEIVDVLKDEYGVYNTTDLL